MDFGVFGSTLFCLSFMKLNVGLTCSVPGLAPASFCLSGVVKDESVDIDSSPGKVEFGSMVSCLLAFGGGGAVLSSGFGGVFFFEFFPILAALEVADSGSESESEDEDEEDESDDEDRNERLNEDCADGRSGFLGVAVGTFAGDLLGQGGEEKLLLADEYPDGLLSRSLVGVRFRCL